MPLAKALLDHCSQLEASFHLIPAHRRKILETISLYISENLVAHLLVVCTHNSRRSHLGQIWLAVAAIFYKKTSVLSYSGGTEATAFHPNAVKALQSIGFQIEKETNGENPIYSIGLDEKITIKVFSKLFDQAIQKSVPFTAIMVCTEADEACPIISGSALRVALPFNDPKAFDVAPNAIAHYIKSSDEIAREMLYIVYKSMQY